MLNFIFSFLSGDLGIKLFGVKKKPRPGKLLGIGAFYESYLNLRA
jgi:hypothetical protein